MFISFLLALQQPGQAPVVPPGASREIHQAVRSIEERMAAGDFAGAKRRLRLLPKLEISLKWDDSKAPSGKREAFAGARDAAIKQWSQTMPNMRVKVSTAAPDVKIDFEPVLASVSGHSAPEPSALFFSESASEPRMECVIGLKRGNPLTEVSRDEVYDEVGYAIGAYLGIAPSPFVGSFMARTEIAGQPPYRVTMQEWQLAKGNLKLAESLGAAIAAKRRFSPAQGSVFIDPKSLALPTVTQGEKVSFSVQITNNGDGPLAYSSVPDCGCISADHGQVLKAGASMLVKAQMDTHELSGDFNRRLFIVTNDPDKPYSQIPITIHVDPLYRLIGPGHAVSISDEDPTFDLFLALSEKTKLQPLQARVTGLPATVDYKPWEGEIADPEHGQMTPLPMKGYRFHLALDPKALLGRTWVSLEVLTDDPFFRILRYNVTVQKGIAAAPDQLVMGQLGRQPREFTLEVGCPRKPFKILSVEIDTPHLKSSDSASAQEEHKLIVTYDGKADIGPFRGTMRIHTDDPSQPVIEVPYLAVVS